LELSIFDGLNKDELSMIECDHDESVILTALKFSAMVFGCGG
jgi:hypothetical protein